MTVRALVFVLALAGFLSLASSSEAQTVEVLTDEDPITITCASNGSSTERTPSKGMHYELIATGDLVACFGTNDCSSGGTPRPKGNHGVFYIRPLTDISCRSADGNSVLTLQPVRETR